MLSIGLTGGIGSGKSTVAAIFETLGIPVLYADDVAKDLMETDNSLISAIKSSFGENAYTDGKLNKKFLSENVFHDPEKVKLLNSIVHPATIKFTEEWFRIQKAPYVIKEAALMFESKSHLSTDFVIGVRASLQLRIDRVIKRTQLTKEEILKRIANQMNEEEKLALCDYIINNDETDLLIPQVLAIHKDLLLKAESK